MQAFRQNTIGKCCFRRLSRYLAEVVRDQSTLCASLSLLEALSGDKGKRHRRGGAALCLAVGVHSFAYFNIGQRSRTRTLGGAWVKLSLTCWKRCEDSVLRRSAPHFYHQFICLAKFASFLSGSSTLLWKSCFGSTAISGGQWLAIVRHSQKEHRAKISTPQDGSRCGLRPSGISY